MPRCLVCDIPAGSIVERHGAYRIRCCPQCGLQFSDPMTGATGNYAEAYDRDRGPEEVMGEGLPYLEWTEAASPELMEFGSFLTAAQQFALQLARKRFPHPQQLPALDIGFGAGWFLGALRAAGFSPYGLEVAEAPVSVLSKKGFATCKQSEGQLPPGWPHPLLITGFEILEHLEDPLGFLSGWRRQYPGAELILSVPDERRWFLLGGREAHDYPPNHLTRWSPQALKLALRRAGFFHVKVWQVCPTAQELSMARIRRFLPSGTSGRAAHRPATPTTTLSQELRKRSLRRKLFWPIAAALPLFGKTACSMVAWGSNGRPL
jgi:hypothetical protein